MRKLLTLLMCFSMLITQLMAQNRTITGKVLDSKGLPVPNASVVIKGTSKGTKTDNDGAFSLSVSSTAKSLFISSIGFAGQDVAITGKSIINITLQSSTQSLEEVVVVGYGTQKKSEVTSSLSKIDAGPISSLVTPSLDKQLGGRAAGLQVTNPSGLVNQPPRIRVRGVNSISGGRDPLIVLDGAPILTGGYSSFTNDNLLGDINPNDVESVEVLKDGSAAAIYGSRAANGVILITTKKGARTGTPKISYSTTFGFSKPLKRFDLLNGNDFVTIANEKFSNAGTVAPQAANPNNINTDWQSVVFRNSSTSQIHNLSIEGSSEKTNYYFSVNYSNQQGLIITNASKRYAVRANLEQRINKWLKVSNYITLSRAEDADQNNGGNSLSGAIYNAIRALPDVSPYDTNNTKFSGFNVTPDGKALGQGNNARLIDNNNTNIAYVLAKNINRSIKHRIIENFGLEIKPVSWLTYYAKANIDYVTLNDFQSLDPLHGDGQSVNGDVTNQAGNTLRWVVQNYLNFNKKIGDHNLGATIGTELQDQTSNSFYAEGRNIADPFLQQQNVISNSYVTQLSGGGYSEGPSFLSYFGRVNYDYKGKYFLQGSFRRDGLSKFASDRRYGNFPGVSAGYRISKEAFWQKSGLAKTINDLKIRASWAKVGNINTPGGNFAYTNLYGLAPYGAISGISASQIGNPTLTWETSEKFDYGVDIGLLDNMLTVTVDYFQNKNNNLVLSAPQPVSLGIPGNNIVKNIGSMQNNGIEISVNASVIRKKDFSWDLGVNYTNQSNKVNALYLNQDVPIAGGSGNGTYNLLSVGKPINVLYGYAFSGVNPLNGNPMYTKADGTLIQGNINDTKYYTVLQGGGLGAATTLAGTDRTLLGNPLAKWYGGINSNLRYKSFSLDFLIRYSGGNKIMNLTRQESLLNQGFTNSGKELLNRWTQAGQVTDIPKLWYGRDNFINLNNNGVSRFVENGDFVRLDNLQLTYNVEQNLLKKITKDNVKYFRFFVQGQNLFVITKYKGVDPDNINEQGIDYNTSPPARTISFGLNVGF